MATDTTSKNVEEFTADAQKSIEQGVEKMAEQMEDMTSFGQQNMEAMVAASKRAAKAAEEMNAEVAAFTKKSYEDSMAAAKEMTSAKSVTELFEKQSAFAKSMMEAFVSESTKLNELATTAGRECMEPINARMTASAEMMKSTNA